MKNIALVTSFVAFALFLIFSSYFNFLSEELPVGAGPDEQYIIMQSRSFFIKIDWLFIRMTWILFSKHPTELPDHFEKLFYYVFSALVAKAYLALVDENTKLSLVDLRGDPTSCLFRMGNGAV